MDGSEVGVLEEGDKVRLRGLLEGHDSRRLEAEVGLVVYHSTKPNTVSHTPRATHHASHKLDGRRGQLTLGDFTDEALEGQLADEELGALLIAADLTEGDGTRAEAVGLLHAAGRRGCLAGLLGGELLARSLATGRLAGGLLRLR